ncbi:glycerate dehydrogenase [Alishewanella longhuensis]|uniref:Glycerate dehydrogenase n=1 Tax=Alishewanella longhuensis TaxID=1091037 RepID=A0ABQ3KUK6_9ALTE|nr:NAD(P)-dependent oxidoreductase [Alishewanella longhuensis]GHG61284.1 glycerate dehydrogenase [Alishewanella longhuensis]
MRYNLVFLDAATLGDADLSPLQQANCQLALHDYSDPADVVVRLQHADIAIVNKCVLDATTLQQLPRLKAIMIAATGTDNVDIKAAAQAGILVKNVRNYAETAVPQQVFALLLALTNQLLGYHQAVRAGQWANSKSFCLLDYPLMELANKTMVIVGYGALGQATARLAEAFGMEVIVAERPDALSPRPGRMLLRDAFAAADVVSLHCPLTEETRHLLNTERLSWLKAGAIIINTARGALIEPAALIAALQQGRLKAAGLDVLAQEPPTAEDALLNCNLPNLLITPHTGWATAEARARMVTKIANNITEFIASRLDR